MEYERKPVTIIWQIENVKYIERKQKIDLYSSVIPVDVMDGTKWKLGMRGLSNSAISLTLKRAAKDNGPKEFGLHYSFYVSPSRETSSTGHRPFSYTFQNDQRCPSVVSGIPEIHESLDTITIQCKIWRQIGSIPKPEQFLAQTQIGAESKVFRSKFPSFSNTTDYRATKKKIVPLSMGESVVEIELVLNHSYQNIARKYVNQMRMKINPLGYHLRRICNIKIFPLDSSGNRTDIGKFEKQFALQSFIEFDLPVVANEILGENSALYLRNDTLSLLCKITFTPGIEYEKVEQTEDKQDLGAEIKQTDFSNAVDLVTSRQKIPCDANLQTATETFAAHKDILIAQSPIFESMFKSNMKDIDKKCVHIDDVDAETVKHILVFLYSDTLEELDWKVAAKLYIAAGKYQLLSLKQKCFVILKQSIDLCNCCVLFYLADMHQDNDLKMFTQNSIAKYDREVLTCDQWKELEKNHPHLAIYYFRNQYLERSLFKF